MPLLRAAKNFVMVGKRHGLGWLWPALPRGWRIAVLAIAGWLVVLLLLLLGVLAIQFFT